MKKSPVALALLLAAPCHGVVTDVQTVDVGNKTNLASVTLTNGRVVPIADITNIDVFHYFRTASGSGSSTTFVSPDSAAVLNAMVTKSDLMEDIALNTGAGINMGRAPAGNAGLAIGTSPTAATPGLGINFLQPVVNGPGEDIILFDFKADAAQAGDPIVVTALAGGSGYAGVSTDFAFVTTYEFTDATLPNNAYTQPNPMTSLADLDGKTVTTSTIFAAPGYRAVAIELSALNIPIGGSVSGLFIQAQNAGAEFDPTFIGGLSANGIIGYTGTGAAGLETLTSVDVLQNGELRTIDAGSLVNVTVTHFKNENNAVNNILQQNGGGAPPAGGGRSALLEDFRVDTGLINSGFAAAALTTDPVIDNANPANSTAGLAVEFNQPIRNGAGIDVIVFEISNASNPNDGDNFHVSPLAGLGSGLNSITITDYDIDYSEAQDVSNFDQFTFTSSPKSIIDLESLGLNASTTNNPGFRLLAVGIDLSWLGYAPDALVNGLFFQSADSANRFDPVLIVGIDSAVPEPASAVLLLGAAAAFTRRRRVA